MKPIPFNTEMVQAILEGRKTVTRRPVKTQPDGELLDCPFCGGTAMENDDWVYCDGCGVGFEIKSKKLRRRIWNTRAPILTPAQIKKVTGAE